MPNPTGLHRYLNHAGVSIIVAEDACIRPSQT